MRAHILAEASDLFRHVSAEKAAFYRASWMSSRAPSGSTGCNCGPTRCSPRPLAGRAAAHRGGERRAGPAGGLGQPGIAAGHGARLQPQRLLPRPLPLPAVAGRRGGRSGAGASSCRRLQRRAELQTVALEDIASRLQALQPLADERRARRRQGARDAARPGARVREPGRQRPGVHGRRGAQHRAAAGRSRLRWPATSAG